MALKDLMMIPTLLAFFGVRGLPDVRDTVNYGSVQIIGGMLRPVGTTDAPDGITRGSILAGDIEQDVPTKPSHPDDAPSPSEPPAESSDPGSNRDIDRPQRASPEAANDLFQLLKQAGPKQGSKPK